MEVLLELAADSGRMTHSELTAEIIPPSGLPTNRELADSVNTAAFTDTAYTRLNGDMIGTPNKCSQKVNPGSPAKSRVVQTNCSSG